MKLLLGSTAMALGLCGCLSGSAAAQQLRHACDETGDGFVDTHEARRCSDREFDRIGAGASALSESDLTALSEAEEGVGPAFADIDANGDGQINRNEWVGFGDRRFAGASAASGGRMTAADYAKWRREGMRP